MDIFCLLPDLDTMKKNSDAGAEYFDKLHKKDISKRCCTFKKTGEEQNQKGWLTVSMLNLRTHLYETDCLCLFTV